MRSAKCLSICVCVALVGATALAGEPVDSGALDPAFGAGGKVQISATSEAHGASNLTATDTAIQSSGKIVVTGSDDQGDCFALRLNIDGSLDTGFGGIGGFPPGFTGYAGCVSDAIVLRPDDRIVMVMHNPVGGAIFAVQFSASGVPDAAFTNFGYPGVVQIQPASGDSMYSSRAVIDSDGTIDIAGFYHQQSSNNNQFLFVRISADGKAVEPLFQYAFGSGNNQDDHALDLAIDSQGRYVVGGYHRGAGGNYDCAVIRITHDLYDVDHAFGNGGQTIVPFDLGGDNGDFCNALTVVKPDNYIVLGGHASASVGSGSYQAAVLALLDNSGNVAQHDCAAVCQDDKFAFAYDNNPSVGASNGISKLIVDNYDTKFPQILAVGSGNQPGVPYGLMFGIARLNLPVNTNFVLDSTFNGGSSRGVFFAAHNDGIGLQTTTNYGLSAAFAKGSLVAAGYTAGAGGNAIAVTRLAAFDGIFKNSFELPYY
ncbi:hypothetical protein [Pseudolysobacter antarcticus]|nr:hypothetical protein [Pseudolysobacter antarcticus]